MNARTIRLLSLLVGILISLTGCVTGKITRNRAVNDYIAFTDHCMTKMKLTGQQCEQRWLDFKMLDAPPPIPPPSPREVYYAPREQANTSIYYAPQAPMTLHNALLYGTPDDVNQALEIGE